VRAFGFTELSKLDGGSSAALLISCCCVGCSCCACHAQFRACFGMKGPEVVVITQPAPVMMQPVMMQQQPVMMQQQPGMYMQPNPVMMQAAGSAYPAQDMKVPRDRQLPWV
jgi:hypothetical protein